MSSRDSNDEDLSTQATPRKKQAVLSSEDESNERYEDENYDSPSTSTGQHPRKVRRRIIDNKSDSENDANVINLQRVGRVKRKLSFEKEERRKNLEKLREARQKEATRHQTNENDEADDDDNGDSLS